MSLVWDGMPIEEMNEKQLRETCTKLSEELSNLLIQQAKQDNPDFLRKALGDSIFYLRKARDVLICCVPFLRCHLLDNAHEPCPACVTYKQVEEILHYLSAQENILKEAQRNPPRWKEYLEKRRTERGHRFADKDLVGIKIKEWEGPEILGSCPICYGDFVVKCDECGAYPPGILPHDPTNSARGRSKGRG